MVTVLRLNNLWVPNYSLILKMILTCHHSNFTIISNWIRTRPFVWRNLSFPLPKHALYHVWLNLALWFWRADQKIHNAFSLFRYFLSLNKDVVLVWLDLNSLCQFKMKLAFLFLKTLLKIVNVLLLLYLLLERVAVYLKKFEFSLPKNVLCQVKLGV